MMRDRLLQVRKLLSEDGSVWVHCDDSEMAYLKAMMDEVFGRSAWVSTIVWQKRTSRDNRAAFSSMHDYLLVYAPIGPAAWKEKRNRLPDARDAGNPDEDPRGPWRSVPMSAQAGHATRDQFYRITSPGGEVHDPPRGRAWTYTRERFEELLEDGRIYWPRDGRGRPRIKKFVSESDGLVPFTIWSSDEVGQNSDAKRQLMTMFPDLEPFATPKPEALLQRIIHIGSGPGDIVLDFFAGSGTTGAVAHKMGRRWVLVERSDETLRDYLLPRLRSVVRGDDPGGVTKGEGWSGGGAFRVLDVAPSMFEVRHGVVFLAEWAVGGDLAEATAAQLGFRFDASAAPFCGWKGRRSLAVFDGRVNEEVVSVLARLLGEGETMVVCATSVAPGASEALPAGSAVRKIPNVLLDEYRRRYRARRRLQLGIEEGARDADERLEHSA